MVDDWVIKTMYATKRRRRTVKSVKPPVKDPPKSNPSKRHRERLNAELDHLASLLPFEQSVISKLDKLSILRLAVSYLRIKSYFQAVLPDRYSIESHLLNRSHLFPEPGFSEGDSILQALYGFLFVVTCEGEVFFASRTVEQYLGFHQSDIIHQSVMELIHSEDREEFKRQLLWNSSLPPDKANLTLHEIMLPENNHYLHRSFTVRFRCLLDNTSGFITLEISGWIRILHGQALKSEEPMMALFATCCPFGPLSLFDIPSRDLTFKSKHKMDLSPLSMDSRGKMMFGYSDRELITKSGYDLVHPDDLSYFAAAHQELIKTGSSGLIAYRWIMKDLRWLWLQSSCKVVYKNSKPDFVICTHRQLTDDEGQDLFGKRGNEFKLPYPLLDLDICSGSGFPEDDFVTKSKTTKNKKQKSQVRDYLQASRKRKATTYRDAFPALNGYASFSGLNGYGPCEGAELKPDLFYSYTGNNFALDSDIYRSHGYTPLPGSVYSPTDPFSEKHCYSNGYYFDHRQYQHPLSYHSNSYADLVAQSKYGYDIPKYGFDGYSIDLSKKVHFGDEYSRYDNDYRKYGYEYSNDRLATRINGNYDPMEFRSSAAVFNGSPLVGCAETSIAPGVSSPTCLPSTSIYKTSINDSGQQQQQQQQQQQHQQQHQQQQQQHQQQQPQTVSTKTSVIETKVVKNSSNSIDSHTILPHNTVIKNIGHASHLGNSHSDHNSEPHNNNGSNLYKRTNVITSGSSALPWTSCVKSAQALKQNLVSNSQLEHRSEAPPQQQHKSVISDVNTNDKVSSGLMAGSLSTSSPITGSTPASVIQLSEKASHNRSCEKQQQPVMSSIPVPVVKSSTSSPWLHQYVGRHSAVGYGCLKDWASSVNAASNTYPCHQKVQQGLIPGDTYSQAAKVGY